MSIPEPQRQQFEAAGMSAQELDHAVQSGLMTQAIALGLDVPTILDIIQRYGPTAWELIKEILSHVRRS